MPPSLVEKFFNIFNFFIGINSASEDVERALSQRPMTNFKVEKVMMNEFAKLAQLKTNPESIERKIVDKSDRQFVERRLRSADDHVLSLDEFIQVVESERVGVIVGAAGAGKTRTVVRVCEEIQKRKSSGKLVFHVDLATLAERFQTSDLNFNEKFSLKFLLNFDSYEYEAFREMCASERVLLFLDGFDEIAHIYKHDIINLLQSIRKNTKASFWVVSRPCNSSELELKLQAKSFQLLPFTYDEAKPYLHSILSQISYDRSRLERMLERFFSNPSDSLNQPFILIEEILLDRHANESLTEDIDLIHIFVKRKIEFGEFSCDSSLLSLLRLALHTIFGDKFLLCASKSDKTNRCELLKSRLITCALDGSTFEFVDRSFAAYFIAEYLIKNVWIYGSFFPPFEGDKRLVGAILDEVLHVKNHAKYLPIYNSIQSIIECGKVKERIAVDFECGIRENALMTVNWSEVLKLYNSQVDESVRVLKVTKLAKFRDTFELLSDEKFHQFLSLNPKIFMLILKFADSADFGDQNVVNHLQYVNFTICNPPLLLSFECITDNGHLIYHYRNEKYQKLTLNDVTEENFLQTIKTIDMSHLLSAVRSGVIGSFYGKVEETRVRTRDFYNKKRLIDYALEHRDETCIKFLQLFDTFDVLTENLKSQTILEILAEGCSENEFELMMGDEISLMDFRDKRGRNLLMVAAEAGNVGGVRFFLKLNFDIDEKVEEQSATDLAFEKNHFEILNVLLQNNSKYPSKITMGIFESDHSFEKEKLKQFIKVSEDMHNGVARDDQSAISSLCESHPHLRHFYNLSNESAMARAMRNRKIQLCHLLSSKNVFLSASEQSSEDLHFESEYPQMIKVIDDFPSGILSKTFISAKSECRTEDVARTLLEMSKIPEVNALFKVASKIDGLEIIFDPHRKMHGFNSLATLRIVVGAQKLHDDDDGLRYQILATFIQRLCQASMKHLYGNDGNPYRKSDVDTKLKFFKIAKHCYEHCEKEASMKTIFRTFSSESWHRELIALVPYLTVLHQRNTVRMAFVRRHFRELFEFYEKSVM